MPRVENVVEGVAETRAGLPRGFSQELDHVSNQRPEDDSHLAEKIRGAGNDGDSTRASDTRSPQATPPPKAIPRKPGRLPAGEWPELTSDGPPSFGNWLKAAREGRGLSQDKLAIRIGRPGSGSYIGQMERTGNVTDAMAQRLFDALDAPEDVRAAVLQRYQRAPVRHLRVLDFPDPTPHRTPNSWFREARVKQELSQAELASRAGVSKSGYAMRERAAKFDNPRGESAIGLEYARKLLRGLEAPEHVTVAVTDKFFPGAVSEK
ncbi:helix-turn-helix transcriptional regulator [Nocardia sp. NPDC049190]|uniref:helix-turn-helix domain-containing protein n=1 Tax=Nocardia sp. NPDC049190 TaxID=3155650 RepID=UPI0033F4EEC0